MTDGLFGYMKSEAKQQQKDSFNYDRFLQNEDFVSYLESHLKLIQEAQGATESEKEDLVNRVKDSAKILIQKAAEILNVTIQSVDFISDEKKLGAYYYSSKKIELDYNELLNASSIQTILHELRHAEQHQVIMQQDTELSSQFNAANKSYTLGNVGSRTNNILYHSNILEFDAETFSYGLAGSLYAVIAERNFKASTDFADFVSKENLKIVSNQAYSTNNMLSCMQTAQKIDFSIDLLSSWRQNVMSKLCTKSPNEIDRILSSPNFVDIQTAYKGYFTHFHSIWDDSSGRLNIDDDYFKYAFKTAYKDLSVADFILTMDIDPFINNASMLYKNGNKEILDFFPREVSRYIEKTAHDDEMSLTTQERANIYINSELTIFIESLKIGRFGASKFVEDFFEKRIENCLKLAPLETVQEIIKVSCSNKTINISGDSNWVDYARNFLNKYKLNECLDIKVETYNSFDEYCEIMDNKSNSTV